MDDHVICTPLKALKEAVRLATPSPVKHIFRRNIGGGPNSMLNTPFKSFSGTAQFTPSPCKRPPTTPAKW